VCYKLANDCQTDIVLLLQPPGPGGNTELIFCNCGLHAFGLCLVVEVLTAANPTRQSPNVYEEEGSQRGSLHVFRVIVETACMHVHACRT
jgi:hypothetical protein